MERNIYERYTGNDTCVKIDSTKEQPIVAIGTKAFLNCKTVEQLVLPETLEEIGDWAFAHMKNLKKISLPAKEIKFGKKVFLGCEQLNKINLLGEGVDNGDGVPDLLATLATHLQIPTLRLELLDTAEGHCRWLQKFDKDLLDYLEKPDTFGFEPAFIGWFDVEDVDDQKEKYITDSKRRKILLCFQRLHLNYQISEECEMYLKDYLLGKKDSDIPKQLEDMIGKEPKFANSVTYIKIWKQIGGFAILNALVMLEKMTDADPEVRAFLMDSQSNADDTGFFDNMLL